MDRYLTACVCIKTTVYSAVTCVLQVMAKTAGLVGKSRTHESITYFVMSLKMEALP